MLVQVYRNLNTGNFSIRHKGKVIAHASHVTLTDVRFHVNTKAQAKIKAGAHRSVHAWVTGILVEARPVPKTASEVTYRPHQEAYFFDVQTGKPVTNATTATLINNKLFTTGAI